jgi:hypothetical protein
LNVGDQLAVVFKAAVRLVEVFTKQVLPRFAPTSKGRDAITTWKR